MLGDERLHEPAASIRCGLDRRQRPQAFPYQIVLIMDLLAGGATLQMIHKLWCICLYIVTVSIHGEQCSRLVAVHSSPTSFLYNAMKRSLARMRRIFTAEELILSTPAISAQERPSFS